MLKFNLNVPERKTLAKRMEELTGIHPYYTRAPLYAYTIGNYTIDREGSLLVEEANADAQLLGTLLTEGLITGGEAVGAAEAGALDGAAVDEAEDTTEDATVDEAEDTTEDANVDGAEGTTEDVTVDGAEDTTEDAAADDAETASGDTAEAHEPDTEQAPNVDEAATDDVILADDADDPIPDDEYEQEAAEEAAANEDEIDLGMSFDLPMGRHTGVSLRNLLNLLYTRGELIRKATGGIFKVDEGLIDELKDDSCTYSVSNFFHAIKEYEDQHGLALEGLTLTPDTVSFTGFPRAEDAEHLTAFGNLAALMNKQAISQKRIQAKGVDDSNERYAMRIWLLRLGMNGDQFKQTRKLLMEHLGGHTAFRTTDQAERAREKAAMKRTELKAPQEGIQEERENLGEPETAVPEGA